MREIDAGAPGDGVASGHFGSYPLQRGGGDHPQPAPDAPAPQVAPDGLPGPLWITQSTKEGGLHTRRSLRRTWHAVSARGQEAGPGPDGARRAESRTLQPVPVGVLRWPAAA